ncbi:hypothetical protein CBR_g29314 [Chara braunii]|uniref:Uncharacterized protein n=1 Tax=Chara braunii TaxID=69332 RepID=A0A388JWD6_CHABU|nr:hypothetical protein CBR_g29314 [Chara braunii]|eukprot:GBG62114.1 hypothetical protein CBR_g29314 [Chara braunii]
MKAIGDAMTKHVACAAPGPSLGSTCMLPEGAGRRGRGGRGRWDGGRTTRCSFGSVGGDAVSPLEVGEASCSRNSGTSKKWPTSSSCSTAFFSSSSSSSSSSSPFSSCGRTSRERCLGRDSSKCSMVIVWTTPTTARGRRRSSGHVSALPGRTARRAAGPLPGTAVAMSGRGPEGGNGQQRFAGFPSIQLPPSSGSSSGSEPYLPFRPPPGMSSGPSVSGTTEDHLEVLRERRAAWQELAPYLSALARAGFTPATIDEATGLTGVEQNNIIVGAQVYNSLRAGGLDPDVLAEFEVSGAEVLYELRILSNSQRKAAAEYVSAHKLDAKGARDLARAIKDHERKRGGDARRFFSTAPGDCLAFSYYRLSREGRSEEERKEAAEKGLEHAVTESARQALEAVLRGEREGRGGALAGIVDAGGGNVVMSKLELHRLTADEVSWRVVPLVGDLASIDEEAISMAPKPRLGTASGAFCTVHTEKSEREEQWAVVPGWVALAKAASPVALIVHAEAVKNRRVPDAQWAAMRPEIDFPVLLIVDREVDAVVETEYYIQGKDGKDEEKGVLLVTGSKVLESGRRPCGRVVLGMKPPLPQVDDDTLDDS